MRDPEETRIITERLVLALAGSKGDLIDEYNSEGKNAKCLAPDSKLMCVELLSGEWF